MEKIFVLVVVVAYFSVIGAVGLYWIARKWTYDAPGARAYVLWVDKIIKKLEM